MMKLTLGYVYYSSCTSRSSENIYIYVCRVFQTALLLTHICLRGENPKILNKTIFVMERAEELF